MLVVLFKDDIIITSVLLTQIGGNPTSDRWRWSLDVNHDCRIKGRRQWGHDKDGRLSRTLTSFFRIFWIWSCLWKASKLFIPGNTESGLHANTKRKGLIESDSSAPDPTTPSWSIFSPVRPTQLTGTKHWALPPQKPLRLLRDGEVGRFRNFISNTYSLHCHHLNDSALMWAVVWAILVFH